MNIKKLWQGLDTLREKTQTFFYGNVYPVIFSLSTFLFWILNLQMIGFTINILAICFILFTHDDALPTLPIVLLTGMSFRNSYVVGQTAIPIIIFGLALLAILFNLVKYPIKKIKKDNVLFALILVTLVLVLGGLFTPYLNEFSEGLPILFTAGVGMLGVHFFYLNKINVNGKTPVKQYFCHSFLCAVNVACGQALFAYVHTLLFGRAELDGPNNNLFYYPGGFCWANSNHISSLILLAIPVCLYILTHTNNFKFYLFQLIFLYVTMLFTFSDGATAVLAVFTPILLYFTLINIDRRNYKAFKIFVITVAVAIALVLSFIAVFYNTQLIQYLIKHSSDNGRIPIYIRAIRLFANYPVFGVGLGHASVSVNLIGNYRGFFHSTFFHISASCGLVGICAYAYLYYARIKHLVKNGGFLGFFALMGFLMFAIYAIVENSELNIVVLYITLMITFIGLPTKKAELNTLPLHKQFNDFTF